ncbi:DnaK suppressor protein [Parvibaculum indicum]|uniref:TraR/DksA family transcriptional regulator n=1 Tax=Parvibaculum indicum TaxID=562969 RepID=UPI00141EC1B8|nr:TraR/DksA C4-type zinc finger protein [Parvibaculum indicum]NIJ40315.1 DnaK suppressor protein [Parvibaculum indicum]
MSDRPLTDDELATLRRELSARLKALQASRETSADDRKPVALDQQSVGRLSRMDAMQMQAMAKASEQRRRQEGLRIEAAIERIDEGEYGYCVTCGDGISEKRLKADPTIPTCINCAK